MRVSVPFALMFLLAGACAPFHSSRSYLTEMEQNDGSFFEAGNDFPVMAGDTGRDWRSKKELRARTPASAEDLEERRGAGALKNELRGLEESQSENSLKLYERYRDRLASNSEKVYFLKLSPADRKEYLESRGFISQEAAATLTPHERMHALRQSNIMLGMSKDDVQQSWGKPQRREIAGNPSYENERWAYGHNGATKYIYFEAGKVEGWE